MLINGSRQPWGTDWGSVSEQSYQLASGHSPDGQGVTLIGLCDFHQLHPVSIKGTDSSSGDKKEGILAAEP